MNIKILFIFLVLLLVAKSFTKEHLSKDFLAEASGGMLQKKNTPNSAMDTTLNKDPSSTTFESDLNKLIQEKTGDERAVVVDGDASGIEVNKPAKVEQTLGKDLKKDEEEGSGCSDTLVFGLVLLLVVYTVYFKIKN
jgi:hypothetical protein